MSKRPAQSTPLADRPQPSTRQLLKATALAISVAAVLLVTFVLPAEYGIDPTGIGTSLGLNVLGDPESVPDATVASETPVVVVDSSDPNAVLAAKSEAVFGANEKRSLDANAVSLSVNGLPLNHTFSLTLEPGKGAEVKARLKSGDGFVFHWTASGDVQVDMHGERPNAGGTWTSYAVEAAQRESAGTFVAPFEGSHGWYWRNRGTETVTVELETSGFQPELYRP